MRAVTAVGGRITLVEKDEPSGDGTLIRVSRAGICGSDLHLVAAGLQGVVLGHEFAGTTPDGHLVAVRPTGACGTCLSCTNGHPNTCRLAAGSLHGTAIDGGLADYVLVDPSRIVEMPAGLTDDDAALVEPLAVAVHGVSRVGTQPGMNVLVVGAGSIGLLTVAVLRHLGVDTSIVARHPHQAVAAEMLGASVLSAPHGEYDVTFDAVSSQSSFDTCVAHTRARGTIVEYGLIWSPVGLSNAMLVKEITLVPTMFYSHGHDHDDFVTAAGILKANPAIRRALVTHALPLEEAADAFRIAGDRASGAIKVHLFTNN